MSQGFTTYIYPELGPKRLFILGCDYLSIVSGTFDWTVYASQFHNGVFESTAGAVGDSINYSCYLDAGIWKVTVLGIFGTARGIIQCSLDGTVLGTVDTYAAATWYNKVWIYPAGTITIPGIKIINLYATAKNAGSSDERMAITYIQVVRVQ